MRVNVFESVPGFQANRWKHLFDFSDLIRYICRFHLRYVQAQLI